MTFSLINLDAIELITVTLSAIMVSVIVQITIR
jgi:hypothetical protein